MSFLPAPFNGLSLQANYTYMKISASDPDPMRANDAFLAQNRGVSPKTANFIIGYRQGPVNITATNNWVSESVFGGFVNTGFVQGSGDNRLVLVRGEKFTTDLEEMWCSSLLFNRRISAKKWPPPRSRKISRSTFQPREDYARGGYLPGCTGISSFRGATTSSASPTSPSVSAAPSDHLFWGCRPRPSFEGVGPAFSGQPTLECSYT